MIHSIKRLGLIGLVAGIASLAFAGGTDPYRPPEDPPAISREGLKPSLLAVALGPTLDFKDLHGPWPPDSTYFPNDGKVPQDIVTGDWNRDGRPDLAIAYAYSDEVRWFFGTSSGGFMTGGTLPVGIHPTTQDDLPRRLWAADFDDDGFMDLAVLCSGVTTANPTTPSVGILYGTPESGFEAFQPLPLWPAGTASPYPKYATSLAGLATDQAGGFLMAVGFMDTHQVSLLRHQRGRQWAAPELLSVSTSSPGPVDLALADLDCDGQSDLVVLNRKELQVWQGMASGGFGQKTMAAAGQALTALSLADFNQDGAWDLAVLDGGASLAKVLMGLSSTGHVQNTASVAFPAGSGPYRMLRYDANLDGRDDLAALFLSSSGGQILIGQARADAPLALGVALQTAQQPCGLAAGDFNRDGWPDLAVVNQGDLTNFGNPDLSLILSHAFTDPGERYDLHNYPYPGLSLAPWPARPRGLAWDSRQGVLWTLDRRGRSLVRLGEDGVTQSCFLFSKIYLSRQAQDPNDLALDNAGDLWMPDRLAARLLRVGTVGGVTARTGFSTVAAGLSRPAGIAFDPAQGRLLVSDEIQPVIVAFSLSGQVLASYTLASGQPVCDLAWDGENGCLWSVPRDDPDYIQKITLDESSATAEVSDTIQLGSLATVLEGQAIRSVAVDRQAGGASRFWLLTDSGALIQATFEPRLTSIQELSLLRRDLVAAPEPGGTVLVADGGPRSTLCRLSTASGAVRILERFALRDTDDAPLQICGLARTTDSIYVLDGAQDKVFTFDSVGQPVGNISLAGLAGRRLQGLYVDPATRNLWIASEGRLLEYSASGEKVTENPLPTTAPPDSIGPGIQNGDLALLSIRRNNITVFHRNTGNPLRLSEILLQTTQLANPFRPLTALPVGSSQGGWRLLGAEENALILTGQTVPVNAVRSGWMRYE